MGVGIGGVKQVRVSVSLYRPCRRGPYTLNLCYDFAAVVNLIFVFLVYLFGKGCPYGVDDSTVR